MKVDTIIVEPAARVIANCRSGGSHAYQFFNLDVCHQQPSIRRTSDRNAALGTFEFLINGLTLGFLILLMTWIRRVRPILIKPAIMRLGTGHIVLPLIGPGTVRNSGWVVDTLTNPLNFAMTPAAQISRPSKRLSASLPSGKPLEYINDIKYQSLIIRQNTVSVSAI